jgi:hypothetical protein
VSWQQQERRRHRRAAGTFDLHLVGPDSSKRARVKDISVSGVSCRTDFAIPEMCMVQVDLFLPNGPSQSTEEDPLHCEGAVVRCQAADARTVPSYDMAIFFTNLTDDGRNRIARYVEAHSPDPSGPDRP